MHPKKAASPFLYVGIESKDREFDAKLLLAAAAAERGFIVLLGQHVLLNRAIAGLVPGIFLVKGLNRIQIDALRHGDGRHVVAAINEEMLGLGDAEAMMKDHDRDASQFCDFVFAQGAVDASTLIEHAGFPSDHVVITGNPRIDLLRPPLSTVLDPAARELRARFGRFILVNTNCSGVHPAFGTTDDFFKLCVDVGFVDPNDPEDVADWWGYIEHDRRNDKALQETIVALSSGMPEHLVVVRPHPSEDFSVWARRFDGDRRVKVIREGSHLPWMVAAEAVVHTNCTSGVEAEVLGRPVVSLAPSSSPIEHWFMANHVNFLARTPDEVVDWARRVFASKAIKERASDSLAALDRHLALGGDGFAFDRIADHLAQLTANPRHLEGRVVWKPQILSDTAERTDFARAKASIALGEISERLTTFSGLLDRFGDIVVEEAWESLFVLSRRGRLILPPDRRLFRSPDEP